MGGSVSESLAGTAVDETMKLGGWRSERVATNYIGATTSAAAKGKRRTLDAVYDAADKLPLSPAFILSGHTGLAGAGNAASVEEVWGISTSDRAHGGQHVMVTKFGWAHRPRWAGGLSH